MIKYLGSKRTLVPALGAMAEASGAKTAVDLFTGTTRVAQEFKRRGLAVTANDIASYSKVLGDCYIATDASDIDSAALEDALAELNALAGKPGYVTQTFCEDARYFHPKNGARIDAMRDHIEEHYAQTALYPVLLTSLLEAADRVDSTTGLQMAYLKKWAPRALNDIKLVTPELIDGQGTATIGDAREMVRELPYTDLMYLDPPYNQHRYFTNYHVWETLVRWDAPEAYGVAQKRIDARDEQTKSVFNKKREMPVAFADVVSHAKADMLMVSYNNEAWIDPEQMTSLLRDAGYEATAILAFDRRRYVGARIGIYNRAGSKVGKVTHLRNLEYVFLAGDADTVARVYAAGEQFAEGSGEG